MVLKHGLTCGYSFAFSLFSLQVIKKKIAKTADERKEITELKTVPLADLTFSRNLGQGTFGLVKLMNYKTKTSNKKMVFAMKCMQKEQICNYKLSGNILYVQSVFS